MDEKQDDAIPESVSTSDADDAEPRARDEFLRLFFNNVTTPHNATAIIGTIVVLYFTFAWLIIAPVVEAFWPG